MSSSYGWKLRALLKKNLILMKRNFISTLFEIFFPSIIIIVILILRLVFSIDTHDFSEEGGVEAFIKDKSMSSIKYNSHDLTSLEWNGLSLLNPFQICSSMNEQGEERTKIASIGIPSEIKQQMIDDARLFRDAGLSNYNLDLNSFQEFESVQQLNDYIEDPGYLAKKDSFICFGVKFSYNLLNLGHFGKDQTYLEHCSQYLEYLLYLLLGNQKSVKNNYIILFGRYMKI